MKIYFVRKQDGSIGANTTDENEAKELGLTEETESEIVLGYDGKLYLKGDEPERPVTPADYDAAMERHLKHEQETRGYTTRSPVEYANSTNARWAQDAKDWVAHVTSVMEYALEIENRAKHGESVPTVDEFVAGLPKIVWTYAERDLNASREEI